MWFCVRASVLMNKCHIILILRSTKKNRTQAYTNTWKVVFTWTTGSLATHKYAHTNIHKLILTINTQCQANLKIVHLCTHIYTQTASKSIKFTTQLNVIRQHLILNSRQNIYTATIKHNQIFLHCIEIWMEIVVLPWSIILISTANRTKFYTTTNTIRCYCHRAYGWFLPSKRFVFVLFSLVFFFHLTWPAHRITLFNCIC